MQDRLFSETEYVLKEAVARFKKPAILWSGGKDSTALLAMAREAFAPLGRIPFTVCFLDTSYKFPETYAYIERMVDEWKLDYVKLQNTEAVEAGMNPYDHDRLMCCTKLKTEALADGIRAHGFDGVLVGIRWDEHGVRGKESFFSFRDEPPHWRVHPILDWSGAEIWRYMEDRQVPWNPLYDQVDAEGKVFRSIGCSPCTKPIPADVKAERRGRAKDKEETMEQLRALGYM